MGKPEDLAPSSLERDDVTLAEGYKYCEVASEALDYLEKSGFQLIEAPSDSEPRIPRTLSSMPADAITSLQVELAEWYDSVSSQITLLRILHREAEAKLAFVVALVRKETSGTKDNRTAQIETDRRYLTALREEMTLSMKLEAQKDRQKRLERDLSIISRHITVMLETNSNTRRTNNVETQMRHGMASWKQREQGQ